MLFQNYFTPGNLNEYPYDMDVIGVPVDLVRVRPDPPSC